METNIVTSELISNELLIFCLNEERLMKLHLTDKEKYVITGFLGGKTRSDMANELDLTTERVRQIFVQAKDKAHLYLLPNLISILQENLAYKNKNLELDIKNKFLENVFSKIQGLVFAESNLNEKELHIRQLLKSKMQDMDLSNRAYNILRVADIVTVADLVSYNKMDLLKFKNFGKKSLAELEEFVYTKGLHWRMDIAKYGFRKETEEEMRQRKQSC